MKDDSGVFGVFVEIVNRNVFVVERADMSIVVAQVSVCLAKCREHTLSVRNSGMRLDVASLELSEFIAIKEEEYDTANAFEKTPIQDALLN